MWFPYSHGVIQIGCTVSERMDIIMSGNKDLRELSMDEMDKVSGGDIKDHVEYWVKDHPCPKCGEKDAVCLRLVSQNGFRAQIICQTCGEMYFVHK